MDFNAIYLSKNISNMNMKIKSYILTFTLFLCGCVVTANAQNNMTVTDCQGHTYPVVKIGNQYWMAENLQCTKYDTQSERAGATLSTSSISTYAPYYTDGRNATTEYSGNLTSSQRKKLGLLYNWAAAVGLATESEAKNRTTAFNGRRQGICPNGWHLPTSAEWDALLVALGGVKSNVAKDESYFSIDKVDKKLKTTSGWHRNYANGTDEYYFAALPAGYAYGSTVNSVGIITYFWTDTPRNEYVANAIEIVGTSHDLWNNLMGKDVARSVRCVRN